MSEYYRPIPELDEWLRRRMRCCYWKQWRWPRTKIKHLLSLGVSLKEAIKTGVSSKGPYAMSRTPITQMAMSNDWLTAQDMLTAVFRMKHGACSSRERRERHQEQQRLNKDPATQLPAAIQ